MHPYVAQFTMTFLTILTWAIVARALISFLPIDQGSTIYQVLFRITEPVIDPIRRVLPSTGMLDLSPLAAILLLIVLQQMVIRLSEDGLAPASQAAIASFARSATLANASGRVTARCASILRSSSMPARLRPFMRRE